MIRKTPDEFEQDTIMTSDCTTEKMEPERELRRSKLHGRSSKLRMKNETESKSSCSHDEGNTGKPRITVKAKRKLPSISQESEIPEIRPNKGPNEISLTSNASNARNATSNSGASIFRSDKITTIHTISLANVLKRSKEFRKKNDVQIKCKVNRIVPEVPAKVTAESEASITKKKSPVSLVCLPNLGPKESEIALQSIDYGESSSPAKRLKVTCQEGTTVNVSRSLCFEDKQKKKKMQKKKKWKNKHQVQCHIPVVNTEDRLNVISMLPENVLVENIIYVVVDTNVLLADLATFDKVKDLKELPAKCNIILVIPWTVLQELDSLKSLSKSDDKELASNAQKAIKYLHKHFMNCHPRIRGQTVLEASINVGFPVECSDDRILQCCIQYQKKGPNRVLLWSNDYNLNNKALVNSVRTCVQKGILTSLRDVAAQLNKEDNCRNVQVEVGAGNLECKDAKARLHIPIVSILKVDPVFNNIKEVMTNCLGPVLKAEMINAYDDLWTKIIVVKPPWTLKDIFCCILKHWIAVFGCLLKSSSQRAIEKLLDQLKNLSAQKGHEKRKDVTDFANSSLECLLLIEPCLGDHAGVIHNAISELQKILMKCDSRSLVEENEKSMHNASCASAMDIDGDTEMLDLSKECITPEIAKVPPEVDVLGVFHIVWDKINEFCGLILDSFNLKHSLLYKRPEVLPSQIESLNFLSRMICDISILTITMRRMIEQFNGKPAQDAISQDLFWDCLINFLPNLGFMHLQESRIVIDNPSAFIEFCQKSQNRKLLEDGFHQLQEFVTILNECLLMIRNAKV